MMNNLWMCVWVRSNVSEESKQQNSEMSEQLKLRTQENSAMRLEVEDLRKRLEIADLMLQQVRWDTDKNIPPYITHLSPPPSAGLDPHCPRCLHGVKMVRWWLGCQRPRRWMGNSHWVIWVGGMPHSECNTFEISGPLGTMLQVQWFCCRCCHFYIVARDVGFSVLL